MPSGRLLLNVLVVLGIAAVGWSSRAAEKVAEERKPTPELELFNGLIGDWRGVAQPRRNSTKDAWTEKANWSWDFKHGPALAYTITGGKQLQSAVLTYLPEEQKYQLVGTFANKTERTYRGDRLENKLVLETAAGDSSEVHRLTVTELNSKRTLLLLEKRPAEGERYTRVLEVGYTREGTSLAIEGAGEPECIVSGGKGTMSLVYKGNTYWFCCTGCREAFDEDPEYYIAEAVKKAAEKKE